MKKIIMVIDGNSLLHRAFYAIPILSNRKGVYTNAVYGFLNMLFKVIEDYKPYSLAVAFDRKAPTFRHLAYEDYKGTRQKAPDELVPQFDLVRDALTKMGIPIYELDGYEADDILGAAAKSCGSEGQQVLLVTGDKDALQLVSENTEVLLTKKGISVMHRYDEKELAEEYGLTPEQLVDMKGLMGDTSDNIPGVPGIGPKTAIKLLKEYGTLENVLANAGNIKGNKLRENLIIYRQHALLSKDLAAIRQDVPIDCSILSQPLKITKTPELKKFLKELELNTIIQKLDLVDAEATDEIQKANERDKAVIEIKTDADMQLLLNRLLAQEEAAILINPSISIAWQNDVVYRICPKKDLLDEGLNEEEVLQSLQPFFENSGIRKVTNDAKGMMLWLHKLGIRIKGLEFDTQIGAYLLDPTRSKYEIEQLLYDYAHIDVEEADASDILLLARAMKKLIKEANMEDLYRQIEHPLIGVLTDMELEGFKVDKQMLQQLDAEFTAHVNRLTQEITDLAGEPFNINSPKQLGDILFDKLGLPVQKKTKTGYSTDIEVLERLQGMHPIIEKLMDYRQVMKIKSTYIDGLLHVIHPSDGKIHSSFNQTVTATGRISSTEPNLQNIPVRVEMGRRIRKVFTASDDQHVLIDADYSQIELRVLAHISGDLNLIEAFRKKQDIHLRTAADIFGVPMELVTAEQRDSAKAVNFGIIYGISDFGLAKNLGITRARAKKYIESYLNRFPMVKEYMERIVKEGKKNGYVTTLFNRRRDIPELRSRNYNIRSFGERIALNTPIQGTAADIIKLAMIRVHAELKKRKLKSRLILQVHDELIVDTLNSELEEVMELVRHQMENAAELAVPLVVDIGTGRNWYEAK
ncbi:MAG: DNA polymerase I [Caldicoprobacterales bacterium]|jgi:DNA polymerase-1|nr:DNA polymerase I [Clostridiales bacterium]